MRSTPVDTYDDIIRRTVPEPDSSWRPSAAQLRDTRAGVRARDDDERGLASRVSAAVRGVAGIDGVTIHVEVEHARVVLMGSVADSAAFRAVDDAVADVEGVETIHNQLVIRPH